MKMLYEELKKGKLRKLKTDSAFAKGYAFIILFSTFLSLFSCNQHLVLSLLNNLIVNICYEKTQECTFSISHYKWYSIMGGYFLVTS